VHAALLAHYGVAADACRVEDSDHHRDGHRTHSGHCAQGHAPYPYPQ
jgi:hypothetical protein